MPFEQDGNWWIHDISLEGSLSEPQYRAEFFSELDTFIHDNGSRGVLNVHLPSEEYDATRRGFVAYVAWNGYTQLKVHLAVE